MFKPFICAILAILISLIGTTGLIAIISCNSIQKPLSSPTKQADNILEPATNISKAYRSSLTVGNLTVEKKDGRPLIKFQHIGSATILHCKKGKKLIALTCYHVINTIIKNNKQANIFLFNRTGLNKKLYITRVVAKNVSLDLALLESIENQNQDCNFVKLATKEPLIGSVVYAIGTPTTRYGPGERTVTRGVLGNKFKNNNLITYRTDASVFYGNSGGGLFNENQELIGVMFRIQIFSMLGASIVPGANEAIALPTIKSFLRSHYRTKNATSFAF